MFTHLRVAQPQTIHRTRRHVLDQNVRALDQAQCHFESFRCGDIYRHTTLVAIKVEKGTIAQVVRPTRHPCINRLHLDDISTHVAKNQTRRRPRNDLAEFDHAHTFKR